MLSAFFRGWVEVVEDYSTTEKKRKPETTLQKNLQVEFLMAC